MIDKKKIKTNGLLGAALIKQTNLEIADMRMEAARGYGETYEDYMKSFKAKQKKSFSLAVDTANKMTANQATGEVYEVTGSDNNNKKSKSKTSKNTTKYFAGSGTDESSTKRTFF